MIRCSNQRPLLITSKSCVHKDLEVNLIPEIILLTAWKAKNADVRDLEALIRWALDRGTTYFVCAGEFSEKLHDEIDELMYQYDDEKCTEHSINVVTTFHADDTLEEVVEFCVFAAELKNTNSGCIVAILNENSVHDQAIKALFNKA